MNIKMTAWVACCLSVCLAMAAGPDPAGDASGFIRQVVQSLLEAGGEVTFPVADKVVAIDNGEMVSRAEFKEAWPQFAKAATTRKVSLDQFFRDVEVRIDSPLNNKRLMSNRRLLESYTYQEGDLLCDVSRVKEGVENFIGYDKAFLYLIRKVDGVWTLIGIGG
jgi:hypothetical protein